MKEYITMKEDELKIKMLTEKNWEVKSISCVDYHGSISKYILLEREKIDRIDEMMLNMPHHCIQATLIEENGIFECYPFIKNSIVHVYEEKAKPYTFTDYELKNSKYHVIYNT